jgi:hypothetical protein
VGVGEKNELANNPLILEFIGPDWPWLTGFGRENLTIVRFIV